MDGGTHIAAGRTHPAIARTGPRVRYVRRVDELHSLSEDEAGALQCVADRYAFRANDYYLGLIDWDDPADPIRRLIVPHEDELAEFGRLDASNEAANTVLPGVQHKYRDTCLVLVNEICGGYCRYCFRKRLFMHDNHEIARDYGPAIDYIAGHPEITDVLLTGGDPLLMSTPRLAELLGRLREIPHVRTIRIGSKLPAFDPYRILDDPALVTLLGERSSPSGRVYLMTHFDHPREFTQQAVEAISLVARAGVMCVNQCPMVQGVNDDAEVLRELLETATDVGCPQYYVFQGRPTVGNEPYEVPLVRGWQLFTEAREAVSGLSRRARFAMSHASGKVEVVGVDDDRIYLRYHRAKDPADENRVLVMERDDDAYWLDQLTPARA